MSSSILNTTTLNTTGITREVAGYVAATRHADLPAGTVLTTKRLLLDGIGCLLAGTRGAPGAIAARATDDLLGGTAGHSTIFFNGKRSSARDAAFVNGITLYSVGVNDIHKASGSHPGGAIISALLGTSEWLGTPGADMLTAMVAGYDVMGRLGRATIPSHRERGFHPTGTFGTFGSTATIARLLKLDQDRTSDAFGIAGSQAAGLKAYVADGSLTMVFHAGRAAQNGVEAALLARAGFSGPHSVFEDERGFVRATSDEYRMEEISAALGQRFEVDETSFRPYYGCTLTITGSGSTAAILRRASNPRPENIESITVRCHPVVVEEVGNNDPKTLLAARLSMEFNLALVVMRSDVLVGDVDDSDLWNPTLRGLMGRVKFDTDTSMPRYSTVVTIRFKDGSSDSAGMDSPKGDPGNPLSWDETRHKFEKLVAPLGAAARAAHVADLVLGLEQTNGTVLAAAINAVLR